VPTIHVQLLKGRSEPQLQALHRELTATVVRCLDVDPNRVSVQISEFPEGSWSRGGVPLVPPAPTKP
jgi:4-oxalocrotonate tautomerase